MNKVQYLNTLKNYLSGIPESELNEILYDYNEHFTIGMSKGRKEEEIAESLGNPKNIAKEMKATFMINRAENSFTVTHFFQAFLATLGLGFFNLVIVLGPFIGIAATLLALTVVGISFIIAGFGTILMIIFGIFDYTVQPIVSIFLSTALIALGILFTIGSIYINKWFYQMTIRYLKLNVGIIQNRRVKND